MATVPLFVLHNNRRRVTKKRTLLENLSDYEIKKHCGLDYHSIHDIIDIFEPLEGQRISAVPLETKVITFLSYLRSGNFQYSLGTVGGTSQSTAGRIIESCADRLLRIAPQVINFPSDPTLINQTKLKFSRISSPHGFPRVLGVIDGTHIAIKAPAQDEDRFVNRKNYHSINSQVIVDSECKFVDIVAKWAGSTHDSVIWGDCSARVRIIRGELGSGWLLGKGRSYHRFLWSCHDANCNCSF